ncbi:PepSY domain-containing protein [Fredinandcohnia humi]
MRKSTLTIVAVVGILIATLLIWQLTKTFTSAEPLSENEAGEIVEKMYNGKIGEIKLQGDLYKITFELNTGIYKIFVHRETGEVTNLSRIPQKNQSKELTEETLREIIKKQKSGEIKRIEKKEEQDQLFYYVTVQSAEKESTYKLHGATGEIVDVVTKETPTDSPVTPPTTKVRITEEEAKEIALQHSSGVIEEIELEEVNGQLYYFVDVENEQDEEEGTVQIHAISGEVISIVWDD